MRQPNPKDPATDASINVRSAAAAVVAGALGAVAGGIAAVELPGDKFIWTGFVLLPFLALLEIFFKRLVGLFGGDANATRVTLAGALVIAFYATWFAVRQS